MAFICTIPLEGATGKLRELYDEDLRNQGYVASSTKSMSLRPEAMVAWRNLTGTIQATIDPRHYELATIAAASQLRCSV